MPPQTALNLTPKTTSDAQVRLSEQDRWHLEIPSGLKGRYRLAQLDDYARLSRDDFPWHPPLRLSLQARASRPDIAGTWGFGFWNDPFSLSLGFGGGTRHMPALPSAVWYFFASPDNYLSLRDDLPGNGFLSAAYRSPNWTPPLLLLGSLALPLLALRPTARLLRQRARGIIRQDAAQIDEDVSQWHQYELIWESEQVKFRIDGSTRFETFLVPHAPLGW